MPRDVSSSSSEDEAGNSPAEASLRQKEVVKSSKYQCPDDFVCFSHKPCSSSTLTKSNKSELWLIKAPVNFDPRCLQGASVNLSGFQTLKLPSSSGEPFSGHQVYNILASNHGTSDLRLLTADSSSSPAVGPEFSGLLSVCESYGGTRMPPCVVHAAPAPAIPPGLKQRFQPFGSKTPTSMRDEDRKRKKKKKKKDKHIQIEEEEVRIKQEVEEIGQERTEEKSRRKRKKDSEELATVEVKSELDVGALPNDEGSPKKKKKKKKSKTDDD